MAASGSAAITRARSTCPDPRWTDSRRSRPGFGITLVIGVIERDGGTLYCTALTIGPDGALLGRHRKLMPTAMERLIWGSATGPRSRSPTRRSDAWARSSAGRTTCRSSGRPCTRRASSSTAHPRSTTASHGSDDAAHRARGPCFVLSANQFTRRRDYPADYPLDADLGGGDPDAVLIAGGSCVVGPLGGSSPGRREAARRSSSRTSTSATSRAARSTSMPWGTTRGRTSSRSRWTSGHDGRWWSPRPRPGRTGSAERGAASPGAVGAAGGSLRSVTGTQPGPITARSDER